MAKASIYNFTVEKTVKEKVEVKRKNKETGKEETLLEEKEVKVPVEFVIKKPTRRMSDEGETFYATELSKNVKKGIVTKAMLAKQYMDTGGTFTEDEGKTILVLMKDLDEKKAKYQLLKTTDGDKKEIEELQKKIIELQKILIELETSSQTVYQHTADARAERATLLWYTIQLSCKVNGEEYLPYFDGIVYEEQLEDLYTKEESEGFDSEVTDKFIKAVSYWFYAPQADKKEIDKFIEQSDGK